MLAWQLVMALLGVLFITFAAWHAWALPRPAANVAAPRSGRGKGRVLGFLADFGAVFAAFFRKPEIVRLLTFLLLYRFAEAQLPKLVTPFMLDPLEQGGLALRTQDVGIAYGTFGIAALTVGGLLGGWLISRFGLRTMLWPLVLAMHLPNTVYVLLARWQPTALGWVAGAIVVEQFGYGLGFTAYMVYTLMVAGGHDGRPGHRRRRRREPAQYGALRAVHRLSWRWA